MIDKSYTLTGKGRDAAMDYKNGDCLLDLLRKDKEANTIEVSTSVATMECHGCKAQNEPFRVHMHRTTDRHVKRIGKCPHGFWVYSVNEIDAIKMERASKSEAKSTSALPTYAGEPVFENAMERLFWLTGQVQVASRDAEQAAGRAERAAEQAREAGYQAHGYNERIRELVAFWINNNLKPQ